MCDRPGTWPPLGHGSQLCLDLSLTGQPHESQALCPYGLQWIRHLVGAQEIFAEWISFLCSAPVPPASLKLQISKQPDLCRPKQLLCSSPEDTLQEASKLALDLKTMLGPEQGLGSQLPPPPW